MVQISVYLRQKIYEKVSRVYLEMKYRKVPVHAIASYIFDVYLDQGGIDYFISLIKSEYDSINYTGNTDPLYQYVIRVPHDIMIRRNSIKIPLLDSGLKFSDLNKFIMLILSKENDYNNFANQVFEWIAREDGTE